MKKQILTIVGLLLVLTAVSQAADRFYGKITSIDHAKKSLVVHNKKQQLDTKFNWDNQTNVTMNKQAISPEQLLVGQSLMVSYISENDLNRAQKISVRTPFKKSAQNQ